MGVKVEVEVEDGDAGFMDDVDVVQVEEVVNSGQVRRRRRQRGQKEAIQRVKATTKNDIDEAKSGSKSFQVRTVGEISSTQHSPMLPGLEPLTLTLEFFAETIELLVNFISNGVRHENGDSPLPNLPQERDRLLLVDRLDHGVDLDVVVENGLADSGEAGLEPNRMVAMRGGGRRKKYQRDLERG